MVKTTIRSHNKQGAYRSKFSQHSFSLPCLFSSTHTSLYLQWERRRFEPASNCPWPWKRGEESSERCARQEPRALPAPRKDAPGFEARWGAAAAADLRVSARREYLRAPPLPPWPAQTAGRVLCLARTLTSRSQQFASILISNQVHSVLRLFGIAIHSGACVPPAGISVLSARLLTSGAGAEAGICKMGLPQPWGKHASRIMPWSPKVCRLALLFCRSVRLASSNLDAFFGFAPTNADNCCRWISRLAVQLIRRCADQWMFESSLIWILNVPRVWKSVSAFGELLC